MNFLRLIGTLPIQQQENVVRVFHVVEDVKADFSGSLPRDDMRYRKPLSSG